MKLELAPALHREQAAHIHRKIEIGAFAVPRAVELRLHLSRLDGMFLPHSTNCTCIFYFAICQRCGNASCTKIEYFLVGLADIANTGVHTDCQFAAQACMPIRMY